MRRKIIFRNLFVLCFLLFVLPLCCYANNDPGFDYEAYLSANPDLPQTAGKAECINHYVKFGFWENRAVSFNIDEYLNANPDLPSYWTVEDGLNHHNLFGKNENRLLAFDAQEYLSLYSDLPQNWSYDQAYNHFMNYGREEGRIAAFDETAYLEIYSDLPRSWGQAQAFFHFMYFGKNEGRVYDPYDESVFTSGYAVPPEAGKWSGIAGFGGIDLVVTNEKTGLDEITLNFSGFSCGSVTSSGSITASFAGDQTWPISNNKFTAVLQTDPFSNDQTITILGIFENTGTSIFGTYKANYGGVLCEGVWSALPSFINGGIDNDGDGYTEDQGDCNDADDSIYPAATEICGDGIDQDCNGSDSLCPEDLDNDGDGYTEEQGDCNDADDSIYPAATEICGDGIDQDCNGSDSLCPEDLDNDGDGYTQEQGDCNDADDSIYPTATEICGDGIDQDCSGSDETCTNQNGAYIEVKNDFHITQKIYIDDTYIGAVISGQTVTFSISTGTHTVAACDNITGCEIESFSINSGDVHYFRIYGI